MMLTSCEYDPDSLCGPDQHMEHDLCFCDVGFTSKGGACIANAAGMGGAPGTLGGRGGSAGTGGTAGGESGENGGSGGSGDDAGSVDSSDGQGTACSTDADCRDSNYAKCVTMNASSGYCSRTGCSGDCETGYFRATDASPSYCKRLPTGEGATCASAADCTGNDASYCALNPATGTSSCVVPGCAAGGCSPAFSMCFDLSTFIPGEPKICIPGT